MLLYSLLKKTTPQKINTVNDISYLLIWTRQLEIIQKITWSILRIWLTTKLLIWYTCWHTFFHSVQYPVELPVFLVLRIYLIFNCQRLTYTLIFNMEFLQDLSLYKIFLNKCTLLVQKTDQSLTECFLHLYFTFSCPFSFIRARKHFKSTWKTWKWKDKVLQSILL